MSAVDQYIDSQRRIHGIPNPYIDPHVNADQIFKREEEQAIIKEAIRKENIQKIALCAIALIAFVALCILLKVYVIK